MGLVQATCGQSDARVPEIPAPALTQTMKDNEGTPWLFRSAADSASGTKLSTPRRFRFQPVLD